MRCGRHLTAAQSMNWRLGNGVGFPGTLMPGTAFHAVRPDLRCAAKNCFTSVMVCLCFGKDEVIDGPMAKKKQIPQPIPRSAIAFKPEFLDFKRGIRVGHLEDNERITRILKLELEHRYQQP